MRPIGRAGFEDQNLVAPGGFLVGGNQDQGDIALAGFVGAKDRTVENGIAFLDPIDGAKGQRMPGGSRGRRGYFQIDE